MGAIFPVHSSVMPISQMASNEAWQGWPYHIASVFAEMEVQSEINSVFPLSFAYLP